MADRKLGDPIARDPDHRNDDHRDDLTAQSVSIVIDGHQLHASPGETLLEAARRVGVVIPTLCHDDRLKPTGACRMCLVESSDNRRMVPACRHPVADGLEVVTDSARVQRHRRSLLSLYAADAPDGILPGTELDAHVLRYGLEPTLPQAEAPRAGRPDDDNRYILFQPDRCILCARCTRYCDEVEAVAAITLAQRGSQTTIATVDNVSLLDSTCELCGGCIDTCPTGALVERKAADRQEDFGDLEPVRTTCNYCGVGCQFDLQVDRAENKVVRVTSPAPGLTTNDGNLCVKGRFAYGFIGHPERLTEPLIRDKSGQLVATDWDTALQRAADLLTGVRDRHGKDSLGFISSSRCTNEENYLVQKLARAAFGTNNCHQCAAT